MPRVKKVFTEQFQVYLKPANEKFIREETDKIGVSLSYYTDTLFEKIRSGKVKFHVTRPITKTEKLAAERKRKMESRARAKKAREKKQGATATA